MRLGFIKCNYCSRRLYNLLFTWSILSTELSGKIMSSNKKVTKSYEGNADPVKDYCIQHSTPLTAVQETLMSETLKHPRGMMLGAPEVISLNAALIRALGSKKVKFLN